MVKSNKNILLRLKDMSVGYLNKQGCTTLLESLNLELEAGKLVTLIGPNGCGKSTLIKSISGLIPILNGAVYIKERDAKTISASEKSEVMGVVLTDLVYEKNFTIYELVALGRYHYTNWFGKIDQHDTEIVNEAIRNVGLEAKSGNKLLELSDGERQRAMIAKVLAQDAELIILDEPTAHLDLSNRMQLLLLLKNLAKKMGKAILLSTHELTLALQVSDAVWFIDNEMRLEQLIPEELIYSGKLNKTFGNKLINFHPLSATFELKPMIDFGVYVYGAGLMASCAIRMIKRLGMLVVFNKDKAGLSIYTDEKTKIYHVFYQKEQDIKTLTELYNYLSDIFAEIKLNIHE